MLSKKNDKNKGKCPFRKLQSCDKKCMLFREGVRYKENSEEAFPFADCALNIMADNLEAMHNRSFMLQKEVGETKNIMSLKILADLGMHKKEDVANAAIKLIKTDDKKMIGN